MPELILEFPDDDCLDRFIESFQTVGAIHYLDDEQSFGGDSPIEQIDYDEVQSLEPRIIFRRYG